MPETDSSLRALLVSAHEKLDTVLRIQRITTADRMKDRASIQRHGRRIETLEHQVALLTSATGTLPSWHPEPVETADADAAVSDNDDIVVDARRDANDLRWQRRWLFVFALVVFSAGVATSGVVAFLLHRH